MSEFKKILGAMQDVYDGGKEAAPGVPEGQYTLQLIKCALAVSQTSGNPMIKRTHLVVEGDYEGSQIYDNLVMANESNMWFVARFIELMGYQVPDDITEIEDIVSKLNDANPVYTARVKKSGDFTNVNVIQLLEEEGDGDETPAPSQESDTPDPVEDDGDGDELDEGSYVKFEGDGDEVLGEVIALEDTEVVIKDTNGDEWTVDQEDVTVVTESEYNDAVAGTGDEDDAERKLLVDFADAFGVEGITAEMSKDEIATALNEYTWKEDKLTPDEVDLLKRNDVDVKPKPKPKKAPTKKKAATKKKASKKKGKK